LNKLEGSGVELKETETVYTDFIIYWDQELYVWDDAVPGWLGIRGSASGFSCLGLITTCAGLQLGISFVDS